MMKMNICNLEEFFEVVNSCEAPVELVVAGKEPEELRNNGFIQGLLLDMQNGITTLSIKTASEEDTMRMIRFMMEDGKSLAECRSSSFVTAA
ncbi:MAG TPA: hypothetical protein P5075_05555 [Eubacteriales bacterium]|nr:hypothetical protein [Eubacteriales bacterium]